MPDGGQLFLAAFAEAIRPRPELSVSAWADKHRRLSSKSSSEPGPWRTSRVPFARDIMDALSPQHPAESVTFMAGTQVSKTEIGLNWVGHCMDHDPGPMLVVLPTVEVGQRWSKQRLAPMILESPALKAKVSPERSRDGSNTSTMKEFPNGLLIIGGANSAASLSSMPIKKLFADEVDKYPRDVGKGEETGGEGDPLDLAEARQSTFTRRKTFKTCSPTIESLSRINKEYQASSQGEYFVPCPHCFEKQLLVREHLTYPEGHPEEAKFACIHCGALIDEHHKTWMLENGEWRHRKPELMDSSIGFWVSGWYTPIGLGKTWPEHARRFEQVKRDPVRLKVFINTVDGLCYKDPTEKLDWEELQKRGEPFKLREIPRGALVLTMGVDVQKDRLEYQIWGWGENEEGWVLDWGFVPGDPMQPFEVEGSPWAALDKVIDEQLPNAFGHRMRVEMVGIDCGYLPDEVLNYTRLREKRGVIAVRGQSQRGKPVIGRTQKWDWTWKGVVHKKSVKVWEVGPDSAKTRLFLRLSNDRDVQVPGERMVHFSEQLPEDYFVQLCAEIYDPHKARWVKVANSRNEALDTAVYAMAAAMHPLLRIQTMRAPQWEKRRKFYEAPIGDLFAGAQQEGNTESPAPAAVAETPAPAATETKRAPNWVATRKDWLKKR